MRASVPTPLLFVCLASVLPHVGFAQSQNPPQQQKPAVSGKPAQQQSSQPPAGETIPSPVSRHYPILVVGTGVQPDWSLRLGMKGPERLDRAGYPPVVLDAAEVTSDQPASAWTYNAKDSTTGATVAVKLVREQCAEPGSEVKYTFRIEVQHAQIGTLAGCAQSQPEKFPEFRKKNQIDMPDAIDPKDPKDKDKDKKTVLDPITKFQAPVNVAYMDSAGHLIVVHGAVHKTAAASGSEQQLSHDGRQLLYTATIPGGTEQHALFLFDYVSGHSREIAGNARQGFWSPDDSRIAYLKSDGSSAQVWTAPSAAPENATLLSSQHVDSLQGWVNVTTVLASDLQNLYWISEDRPAQTNPLGEVYGPLFQILSSDTIRVCPVNPDLLLISAYYAESAKGAPTDATGRSASFFLYEVRSKRRTVLGPADAYAFNAEWSRDGLQIFFSKGARGKPSLGTDRIFWDGTGEKRFSAGSYLVVGK
jgi:hypothetical protein